MNKLEIQAKVIEELSQTIILQKSYLLPNLWSSIQAFMSEWKIQNHFPFQFSSSC